MKILGISGSPRAKGNTDILIHEALKAASEMIAELIFGYPWTMPQTAEKRDPIIFWIQ
jgi:NAD(P)H-dependent FMN reductase